MDLILSILRFIGVIFLVVMVFNFMIVVHEYGHYIAARWRGLVVDRFQIWFGKPIWKKEINGVQYGLGSIPAGGFVSLPQMVTMETIEGKVDDEVKEELPPVSPLDKIIVAFAGPLFSFLLAVAFAVLAWAFKYPKAEAEMTTTVGFVAEGSAAERGGIRPGDKIKSISGGEVDRFLGMGNSVKWQVVSAPIGDADIVVDRDGKEVMLKVPIEEPKLSKAAEEQKGLAKFFAGVFRRPPLPSIGVGPRTSAIVDDVKPFSPAAYAGLKKGDKLMAMNGKEAFIDTIMDKEWAPDETAVFQVRRKKELFDVTIAPRPPEDVRIDDEERLEAFNDDPPVLGIIWDGRGESWLGAESPATIIIESGKSIYKTLQKVFSPSSGIGGAHLSGPVGIMNLLTQLLLQENGWRTVLFFGALLNVNLAILNLLPFPVLDGGHIVMATTEWIRRKPTPVKLLEILQTGFVLMLFGFMAFVTLKDIGDIGGTVGGKKMKNQVEWTALPGKQPAEVK